MTKTKWGETLCACNLLSRVRPDEMFADGVPREFGERLPKPEESAFVPHGRELRRNVHRESATLVAASYPHTLVRSRTS